MDITYRLHGFAFEWDADKARDNREKHGVTSEEAAEVFFDPFYQGGDASRGEERRDFVIGYSTGQRLLVVVHVERGRLLRIVSARPAARAERKLYEGA